MGEPYVDWDLTYGNALQDTLTREPPSMGMIHMAHHGPLPPILEEFTEIMNGCSPDALRRNSFVILRIVCMARYLELKTQEIHEALKEAHSAMGLAKIRPGLTEQDAASAARHHDALARRLKASIASEREALARSSQQETSFASTEARYQQQLASLKAHEVRSLR